MNVILNTHYVILNTHYVILNVVNVAIKPSAE